MIRIVQQPAIVSANSQRRMDRQRRERSQRSRNEQMLPGGGDCPSGACAIEKSKRNRKKKIGPQRIVANGVYRRLTGLRDEEIGEVAFLPQPE